MAETTVLHNPRCSTSRAALDAAQEANVDVEVLQYLKEPLTREALLELLGKLEDAPTDLVRRDATFKELGLTDADLISGAPDVGFPVLVKPSAGGGGKGMRKVERAGDFKSALESCRREAQGAFGDDAVVINSFSKYYCMTGWRIGWMVLPEALVRPVERLAQSLYICAPDLSQIAAARAFACTDDYEVIKQGYEANRKLLLERLPKMGIGFAAQPDGAFYAWCDVSRHTNDSMDFARRMLAEIHVAATPGADFDLFEGERHMRFSYAGPTEAIAEALDRIEAWL